MKRFVAVVTLLAVVALVAAPLATNAQTTVSASTASGDARFFPLEEIKPGMRGVAWTVFTGTEPEQIDVEVLGVLPGFMGPRQSAIIARLSGPKIEKTGVFGGMSGSPVYIDGRLVGAISFNFPFGKEPIAGITPIKQMIDIFERNRRSTDSNQPQEPRSISFTQLASTDWKPNLPKPSFTSAPLVAPVSAGSPLSPAPGPTVCAHRCARSLRRHQPGSARAVYAAASTERHSACGWRRRRGSDYAHGQDY